MTRLSFIHMYRAATQPSAASVEGAFTQFPTVMLSPWQSQAAVKAELAYIKREDQAGELARV